MFEEIKRYSEMSQFQRDFLCGMLKEKRPNKILELGVSAGGTTAIILNCLKELNINAKLYSVDVSDIWYRSNSEETGFIAKKYLKEIDASAQIEFLLGQPIPYVINKIGTEIDFLILDTMHCLPGELLDFLICLPYLKNKCIVVIHDVMENHLHCCDNEIATKLLFDLVTGNKWYMHEKESGIYNFSNIAAFEINKETTRNIYNIFSGLSMSWRYMLDDKDLEKYVELLNNHYSQDYVNWFKEIVNLQKYTYLRKKVNMHYGKDHEWLKRKWEKQKNVFLYGSSHWAEIYSEYAKINHLPLKGWIVSDDQDIIDSQHYHLPICHLKDLPYSPEECAIILALDKKYFETVKNNLSVKGYYMVL